jgi:hypothetical protein
MTYFLLQEPIATSEFWNFISENSFLIEKYLLIIVVIFQIVFFIKGLIDIGLLKNIFNHYLREKKVNFDRLSQKIVDETIQEEDIEPITKPKRKNIIEISIIDTSGKNKIILRIREMINIYLINNYGAAVNFSIIKDIIDREVDVKDEEITQSIPTPLYLGLAATMLGIIFGLMAMPDIDADGSNFTAGINSLIKGVKFAMGASLLGLVLTTVLSSVFYKGAKRKVQKEKNDQLSYLQAKLLPELIKAEDTGVSGLKHSLDKFSIQATQIVNNVRIASVNTGSNLEAQQRVLDKIERLDMTKVSKINLDLFSKLDENMDAFNKFSDYLSTMKEISLNLKDFANRTVAVDALTTQIGSTLENSNNLTKFLSAHFEKIESSGNQARDAVNFADSYFRDAIDKLTEEIDERISKMNSNSNLHDSHLREVYGELGKNLNKITAEHISSFQKSYEGAVPQFEQLNNLKELPPIKAAIDIKSEALKNEANSNTKQLVESIEKLDVTLKQMKNDFNNSSIPNRLNAVEKQMQNKMPVSVKNGKDNVKKGLSPKPTFLKRVGNLFRFRRNGELNTKNENKKETQKEITKKTNL